MILVVDAYNVLKQATGVTYSSDKEREHFIHQLARYAKIKGHTIVLVFDGGPSTWPSKEQVQGISVIYVGTRMTADDYIKKYLQEQRGKEIVLVSSDRSLCSWAAQLYVESIEAMVFYGLMQHTVHDAQQPVGNKRSSVIKTTLRENPELDALMEQVGEAVPLKQEENGMQRKRTAQQLPKNERRMVKKIKKL